MMKNKKKIYIRYSSGLANSIFEFCAGYALSRKLGDRELAFDLGKFKNNAFGYTIDEFNIPNYIKYSYDESDASSTGIRDVETIPDGLKSGSFIANKHIYTGINHADVFDKVEQNIYLCDYFMSMPHYYIEYWDDIRKMLSPRVTRENIEMFKDLIHDRISVGVHFRRGDMLYADFAVPTEDDYYKAAIAYLRQRLGHKTIFCIFGDDIEYAKELLGKSNDIKYIHFLGYDDADMEELVCLSLCDHRILSASSTFGELADFINWHPKRIAINQGNISSSYSAHINKTVQHVVYKLRFFLLDSLFRNHFSNIKYRDCYKKNNLYLDGIDIKKYVCRYNKNDNFTDSSAKTVLPIGLIISDEDEARRILSQIQKLELDYSEVQQKQEIAIRRSKFEAFYYLKDYEKAVIMGDYIWGEIEDQFFLHEYADALEMCGLKKESSLINRNTIIPIKFVVFSEIESVYSSMLIGMGEIAVALSKIGWEVTIVESPKDDTEDVYIKSNAYLTNRHNVRLGCRQYASDFVTSKGCDSFIKEQRDEYISRYPDGKVFVLCRSKGVVTDKQLDVIYVNVDYLDIHDPEKNDCIRKFGDEIDELRKTDIMYILTADKEYYEKAGIDKNRLIDYKIADSEYPYWTCKDRWKLIYNHRISERTINICNALLDFIELRVKNRVG